METPSRDSWVNHLDRPTHGQPVVVCYGDYGGRAVSIPAGRWEPSETIRGGGVDGVGVTAGEPNLADELPQASLGPPAETDMEPISAVVISLALGDEPSRRLRRPTCASPTS
jgi:hypothetical protein